MDAAPQKGGGSAGVPEIVPADRGEARVLEERLEVAVDDVLGVERRTLARREHKPVIVPLSTDPKLVSSSWRLRCPLRASTALWGKSTVRLLAFFGSEKIRPPPSRILC